MSTTPPTPPPGGELPTDDSLLNELAALTGLFNPERIWQEEEMLDDMDEREQTQGHPGPHPDAPPLPLAN